MQSISLADVEKALAASTADLAGGLGLAVLTENDSSPSVARPKKSLMAKYPQARWVSYSPLHRDNEIKGSAGAFGQAARAHYDLSKADVLVTLDSDLLTKHPNSLQYAADWAANRNPDSGKMSRTYAVESRFTATGSTADHRYAVRPSQVKAYLVKLEDEVRRELNETRLSGEFTSGAIIDDAKWVSIIAKDLAANRGKSLVVAGREQSSDVHALVHRLNALLGNVGQTVNYTQEPETGDECYGT